MGRESVSLAIIKKETPTQVFSCEFCEISKNTFFIEHLWTIASGNPEKVVSELKDIIEKLFTWFSQNKMKANLAKRHMLVNATKFLNFATSETVIHNSQSKKLLESTLIINKV